MKSWIPNFITCLNLTCGCIGIVLACEQQLVFAGYAILLAAIFDFFDGMAARLLKAYSLIGKDLDSLADMVSFGLLPAIIIYQLFKLAAATSAITPYSCYIAFIIAVFSALRLAKFNNDTRQSDHFVGVPTPTNAMLIASFPMILQQNPVWRNTLLHPVFLIGLSLVMSCLLVSELPLLSLKFKSLKLKENLSRFMLLLSGLVLLITYQFTAVPLIFLTYLLLSTVHFRFIEKST